jgi:uncharacterized protein YjbI with pentapeptide repeats
LFAADLSSTDLRNADFRDADLWGVSFDRADLRGADFGGASLAAATFDGACLSKANFAHAVLHDDLSSFRSQAPNTAYLGTAEGSDVNFSHSQLDHADFRRAALANVNLSNASMEGTVFPRDWTSRGRRLPRSQAATLCEDIRSTAR